MPTSLRARLLLVERVRRDGWRGYRGWDFPNNGGGSKARIRSCHKSEARGALPTRFIRVIRDERYFGVSEATICSKRGSPRSGSQKGNNFNAP